MVKRVKAEDVAGVIEFKARTSEDPEFLTWMANHKARNGGKVRVSRGATGVRVMFSKSADMELWRQWSAQASGEKKRPA